MMQLPLCGSNLTEKAQLVVKKRGACHVYLLLQF